MDGHLPQSPSTTLSTQSVHQLARSLFEERLERQLVENGVEYTYESIRLPYSLHYTYRPDFILSNGIIIEAKGYLDKTTRAKMVAVKKHHPELDIRFVFMEGDNKISKTSNTTYIEWAAKNKFPAVHGSIPKEWMTENT